jgi:hypothetical protein
LPRRCIRSLIWAAAVHHDRAQADGAHEHDVLRECSSASASLPPASALPPYLTTTTPLENRRM